MNLNEYFYLGKIGKTKSFKGEVFFHYDDEDVFLSIEDLDTLYLKIGNKIVDYPIEKLAIKNSSTAVLKFEGINTEVMAEMLKNSEVYVPKSLIPEPNEEEFFTHDFLDCIVQDEHYGNLGAITYIDRQTPQPLAYIEQNKKEVFFPLIDQFIVKVDFPNKIIYTCLPVGILEINEQ